MLKKVLSILTILSLVICLAACGKKAQTAENGESITAASENVNETDEAKFFKKKGYGSNAGE